MVIRVLDRADFLWGLKNGGSIDIFRSTDDNEEVAFFFDFEQAQVTEPGRIYTRFTRHEVEAIIGRMVSALNQF